MKIDRVLEQQERRITMRHPENLGHEYAHKMTG